MACCATHHYLLCYPCAVVLRLGHVRHRHRLLQRLPFALQPRHNHTQVSSASAQNDMEYQIVTSSVVMRRHTHRDSIPPHGDGRLDEAIDDDRPLFFIQLQCPCQNHGNAPRTCQHLPVSNNPHGSTVLRPPLPCFQVASLRSPPFRYKRQTHSPKWPDLPGLTFLVTARSSPMVSGTRRGEPAGLEGGRVPDSAGWQHIGL